jgi:hypothetical protein
MGASGKKEQKETAAGNISRCSYGLVMGGARWYSLNIIVLLTGPGLLPA